MSEAAVIVPPMTRTSRATPRNLDDETPSSGGGLVVSTVAPSFGAAQTELRTRVSSRATAVTWRRSLPQQPPTTASAGSRLASRT